MVESKKIKRLIKKKKGLVKDYYNIVPFKEPVVFLIRENHMVEFFENCRERVFNFKNSNNEIVDIILEPSFLLTFNYGKHVFKGYIVYENESAPYPQKPILYAESNRTLLENALRAIHDHKTKHVREWGKFAWKVFLGIALVIAAAGFYLIMKPTDIGGAQVVIENATALAQSQGLGIL